MIKITVKGLAKFMTKGPVGQRKVLRDFKFPKPEGFVQSIYYGEARRAIRDYHSKGNSPATLVKAIEDLRAEADRAAGQAQRRLEHNIRAVESYLKHFANRRFRVLQTPRLGYSRQNLYVSATPDLFVEEKGREKLIKLELGADAPDRAMIKIILQVMYEAALSNGVRVRPQDVIYLDASRAVQHRGAKARARVTREIEAACENIEAMWPGIK
jgi:hypothetical protein